MLALTISGLLVTDHMGPQEERQGGPESRFRAFLFLSWKEKAAGNKECGGGSRYKAWKLEEESLGEVKMERQGFGGWAACGRWRAEVWVPCPGFGTCWLALPSVGAVLRQVEDEGPAVGIWRREGKGCQKTPLTPCTQILQLMSIYMRI